MVFCEKCGSAMIRADYYDREGEVALVGDYQDEQCLQWVCNNPGCEDGSKNTFHCSDRYDASD